VSKMNDYTMTVQVPIKSVPGEVSLQEAKVLCEVWLSGKIPDAKLIKFEEEHNNDKRN